MILLTVLVQINSRPSPYDFFRYPQPSPVIDQETLFCFWRTKPYRVTSLLESGVARGKANHFRKR